jgi:hypothetical protein
MPAMSGNPEMECMFLSMPVPQAAAGVQNRFGKPCPLEQQGSRLPEVCTNQVEFLRKARMPQWRSA